MITTIDREGRISLGQELQNHLGVQPGDNIVLEISGNEWIIKAAKATAELGRAGDLLNDGKQASPTAAEDAELLEDIGRIQMSRREVRTLLAHVVSIPRRAIIINTED